MATRLDLCVRGVDLFTARQNSLAIVFERDSGGALALGELGYAFSKKLGLHRVNGGPASLPDLGGRRFERDGACHFLRSHVKI